MRGTCPHLIDTLGNCHIHKPQAGIEKIYTRHFERANNHIYKNISNEVESDKEFVIWSQLITAHEFQSLNSELFSTQDIKTITFFCGHVLSLAISFILDKRGFLSKMKYSY